MFFAFFPCNHSPATCIADSLACSLAIKDSNLMQAVEENILSNFEELFYIPESFKGKGAIFTTAGEGFMYAALMAKILKKQKFLNCVDRLVAYTTNSSNMSVDKSLIFNNLIVRKIPEEQMMRADECYMSEQYLEAIV